MGCGASSKSKYTAKGEAKYGVNTAAADDASDEERIYPVSVCKAPVTTRSLSQHGISASGKVTQTTPESRPSTHSSPAVLSMGARSSTHTTQSTNTAKSSRSSLLSWSDPGFCGAWKEAPGMHAHGVETSGKKNAGAKITSMYDVQKWSNRLGKGSSGSVYTVAHRGTGSLRAAKKCYKVREDDMLTFKREEVLLGNVSHPNIIKIFDFFEDRWCAYFIFELCEGGELLEKIATSGSFTEEQCAHVMTQILDGTSYLHGRHICHRDLKPENFLMSDKRPLEDSLLKITDFGCATFIEPGSFLKTPLGTLPYMAPEVFSGRYHLTCDIWSCGVIAYFLLSGGLPWNLHGYGGIYTSKDSDASERSGKSIPLFSWRRSSHGGHNEAAMNKKPSTIDKEVLDWGMESIQEQVEKGEYSLEGRRWRHISSAATDFVATLMTFSVEERCQGKAALKHEWLQSLKKDTVQLPVLENLATYWNEGRNRSSVMEDMSMHLSPGACDHLLDLFVKRDVGGAGRLSIEDIVTILQQSGMNLPDSHIKSLVLSWDTDGDGDIDYDEFSTGMRQSHAEVQESVCMAAFQEIDANSDGVLSPAELEASRETLLQILTDASVVTVIGEPSNTDQILSRIPTNADGQIGFHEFMLAVTGHSPKNC